jgi:hypothetical protein
MFKYKCLDCSAENSSNSSNDMVKGLSDLLKLQKDWGSVLLVSFHYIHELCFLCQFFSVIPSCQNYLS